jgi:hypothetical protein
MMTFLLKNLQLNCHIFGQVIKKPARQKTSFEKPARNIRAAGSQFRFLTAPRVNLAINNFSRLHIFGFVWPGDL